MEKKKTPKVDKEALKASKKQHENAKNTNQIVKKDGEDTHPSKSKR